MCEDLKEAWFGCCLSSHTAMSTHFTLREILAAQKIHDEPLPSMDDIQQAVLSLISRHQNPDKILLEVLTDVGPGDNSNAHDCVEDVIDQLRHYAEMSEVPFSSHSATWCASHLAKLLVQQDGSQLMDSVLKKKIKVIVDVVKKCMADHGLNRNLFVNTLNKKILLGVEMVWTLHKEDIMTLDLFITNNLARSDVMTAFCLGLVSFTKGDDTTRPYRQQILKDCYGYLAEQAYGESGKLGAEKDNRKMCISLLDAVTKEFLTDLEVPRDICIYEGAFETLSSDTKNLQKFATRHLTLILGHDPNIQVSQALSNHSEWGFARTPVTLKQAFAQLMLVFQENEVIDIFQQFLEEQEVNWQTVLAFVSTFLVCYKGAAPVLQGLINKYLQEGLETCDFEGVISAFLLARHACMEGPHVFMTYAQWFQMTFSETSQNPAGSKKTFSFLMKFLTDIMPFEKAEFLKIHLTKPPFVPEKCRPLMSDYVTLAKTRLMDLKDPFENIGIYEESGGGDSDLNQIESDVEKAIAGFSKSGKVPLTVMEASMFRKPYYMGRFLPALLKPRPLPDDPDDRMNFIEALWQANKIPVNLHNKYAKACKKESAQLLEGIFCDGDDSMDEMVLEPIDQLAHSLTKLKENLMEKADEGKQNGVTGDISVIADKIELVLSTANIMKDSKKLLKVDLDIPVIEPVALQIVDLVLNSICELVNLVETTTWVTQLYSTLTQYNTTMQALIVRLWDLIIVQGLDVDRSQLDGLTAVLIHLFTFLENGQSLSIVHQKSKDYLQDHLISSLSVKTKDRMLYTLRFLVSYLSLAFTRFKQIEVPCKTTKPVIPLSFVRMFTFLACRMYKPIRTIKPPGGVKHDVPPGVDFSQEVAALHSSKQFEEISATTTKWSLQEWLKVECSIDPKFDVLNSSERYSYHHWFLFTYHWKDETDVNLRNLGKEVFLSMLQLDFRENTVKPGKPDLMKILSELVCPAVLHSGPASDRLWLQECMLSWLNQVEDPTEKHGKIYIFFSNVVEFSPHLLFTDDTTKVHEKCIVHATKLINDIILDSLSEGIFLDLKTLSYILQGLATLVHHGHNNYVNNVLQECPCITIAIMMHWDEISTQLRIVFSGETAVCGLLENIRNVLDRCGPYFSVSSLEVTWMEGVALFRAALLRNIEVDAISRIVAELVSAGHCDLLEVWMTLNLCQLAFGNMRNETTSVVESVAKDILRSCSVSLRIFKGICGAQLPNKALPGPLIRALSYSLARLYLSIEHEGKWPDALRTRPHLLSDLLATHSSCAKLYHKELSAEPQRKFHTNKEIDIEELASLVKMISETLRICPLGHIKGISKDVFRECDYSIQVMLRKKVPGFFI